MPRGGAGGCPQGGTVHSVCLWRHDLIQIMLKPRGSQHVKQTICSCSVTLRLGSTTDCLCLDLLHLKDRARPKAVEKVDPETEPKGIGKTQPQRRQRQGAMMSGFEISSMILTSCQPHSVQHFSIVLQSKSVFLAALAAQNQTSTECCLEVTALTQLLNVSWDFEGGGGTQRAFYGALPMDKRPGPHLICNTFAASRRRTHAPM